MVIVNGLVALAPTESMTVTVSIYVVKALVDPAVAETCTNPVAVSIVMPV